jgi:hypothetical protein
VKSIDIVYTACQGAIFFPQQSHFAFSMTTLFVIVFI